MSLTVNDFRNISQANDSKRMVFRKQDGKLGSRKIGWVWTKSKREALTRENRSIMKSFHRMIRSEYGEEMGNMATQYLQEDLKAGRPLTGMRINEVLRKIGAHETRAKSEIIQANRNMSFSLVFGGPREAPHTFARLLDDAVREIGGRLNVDLSDMNSAVHTKFKKRLAKHLAYGGGSSGSVIALKSRKQAEEMVKALIEEYVTDLAEVRAGKTLPRPEKIETLEDALKTTLSSLSRKLVDPKALVQDALAITNLLKRGGKKDPTGLTAKQLATLLQGLDEPTLHRLFHNMNTSGFLNLVAGMGLQDLSQSGMNAYRDLAQNGLVATAVNLLTIKNALKNELTRRNLEVPEEPSVSISSPDDVLPGNREAISGALQKQTQTVMQGAMGVVSSKVMDCILKSEKLGSMEQLTQALQVFRDRSGYSYKAEDQLRFDNLLQGALAQVLKQSDNKTLLALYRHLLSSQMLELRLQLSNQNDVRANHLLGDLNTIEGMIQMELAERMPVEKSHGHTENEEALDSTHLQVLANVEKQAYKQGLNWQTDEYLRGETGTRWRTDPEAQTTLQSQKVTVEQFVSTLKNSDFTINIPTRVLCGKNSPFFDGQGNIKPGSLKLKNVFEMPTEDKKKQDYKDFRQQVEEIRYPTLEQTGSMERDKRLFPISGALNVAKSRGGSAPEYGRSFIVLRDEVKNERTVFLPKESFTLFRHRISRHSLGTYKTEFKKILPEMGQTMQNYFTEKRQKVFFGRLNDLLGMSFDVGDSVQGEVSKIIYDMFTEEAIDNLGDRQANLDIAQIGDLAWKVFLVKSSGQDYTAPFNRMSKMIKNIPSNLRKEISQGIGNDPSSRVALSGYLEGQVFGGVDLTKDLKELHIDESELQQGDLDRARKLAKHLNIPLHIYNSKNLKKTAQVFEPFPNPNKQLDHSFSSFRKELPSILKKYQDQRTRFHELDGTHGRRHICRSLIYAKVLVNMLKEQGITLDTYALYRAVALHDVGREREGEDIFESKSANMAKQYLQSKGLTDQPYLDGVKNCIIHQENGLVGTIEAGILQSSDSLDIIRVMGRQGFDPKRLWILNQPIVSGNKRFEADPEVMSSLIEEISLFIDLTDRTPEELELRDALESGNLEKLEELSPRLKKSRKTFEETQKSIPNDQFFGNMEKVLLKSKEKFPNLYKYYVMHD